ncbi:AraC family ligand binding domain-containing protein [Cohnella rhizosphaerae]|uniref:AraC family ligand binding domain-containing protein n=1 Tax=Cohnella rhizosphaerae TaxID=1457232 RepID=A0A9X4QRA0_9BACL|nr:AraC family ligand binding domain-containing protein [Cohnella rhizosphaerae]MDG0808033.1 AraC family ligand binding domain-containing protein [Cohnella rhizosphaerae]
MSIKPFVFTTTAAEFLSPEVPVFINRVQESFGMWHHDHEFVEINYVSEGTGFQYIEGQFLPVAKGDLFFFADRGVARVSAFACRAGRRPLDRV